MLSKEEASSMYNEPLYMTEGARKAATVKVIRDVRSNPKSHQMWAVYNWGIFWSTFRTRRDALEYVRDYTFRHCYGKKEQKWQEMFEIHKVLVTKA